MALRPRIDGADIRQVQVVPGDLESSFAVATLTGTSDAAVVAAPGAGRNVYVRSVMVSNSSASVVRVDLKDDTTTKIEGVCAANGGGFVYVFKEPLKVAENKAFNGALSSAVTDVRVTAEYFVA